ncbi:hypothetical protein DU002_09365 [Corallincola holothuriorum]|uniref:MSHA biogenesis protein MshP n=1 Tax=Corallincola holothuriorum TaxID=2282215 RepID=A0A368NJ97_9GAMM|nr:hypothetical protein [Corallincola holothuriorum]RCU49835.1 hypothetical protein DU002_09365 [Corallincola holothuriorum]
MYPDPISAKRNDLTVASRQRGSALLLALFIIVVLFVLGAGMIRLLGSSSESVTFEVYGVRAMQAAQTGVERVLTTLFPAGGLDQHCDGTPTSPLLDDSFSSSGTTALNLAGITGLANCASVVVECSDRKHLGVTYYYLVSTATCTVGGGSTALVMSRQVEVEAKSL